MVLMRKQTSRLVLFTICFMYLIFYVDRVNLSTAAPVMQKDLGLTATQLGIAFSAFAYPYAIFQIAGGWLGDRLGPRMTLLICAIVVAGSTIWTGLVGGLVTLFCARLMLGIGEGPAFPTATRALANWMRPDQRGWAQGITHAFARFGNAVTPPLIAALIVAFASSSSVLRASLGPSFGGSISGMIRAPIPASRRTSSPACRRPRSCKHVKRSRGALSLSASYPSR